MRAQHPSKSRVKPYRPAEAEADKKLEARKFPKRYDRPARKAGFDRGTIEESSSNTISCIKRRIPFFSSESRVEGFRQKPPARGKWKESFRPSTFVESTCSSEGGAYHPGAVKSFCWLFFSFSVPPLPWDHNPLFRSHSWPKPSRLSVPELLRDGMHFEAELD